MEQGHEIDTFDVLIDRLREDGLVEESKRLNALIREIAWTTGTEFYGEFGLEMKRIKKSSWRKLGKDTKKAFKDSAKVVKKVWPQMFWWR